MFHQPKGRQLLEQVVRHILSEETPAWPAVTPKPAGGRDQVSPARSNYDNLVSNTPLSPGEGHLNIDEPIRKAACCLIIRRDGKVLAVSRKYDKNAMGLPGGKIDPGETPEQAAQRELKEETGLIATRLNPVFSRVDDDCYETTTFQCDVDDIDNVHTNESGRVAWVTWEKLLNGPFGDYNLELKNAVGV
jgi:8-oxo-dGTP pyrophosphatase MutT (NUDIX family)